jgi:hypothetical protein
MVKKRLERERQRKKETERKREEKKKRRTSVERVAFVVSEIRSESRGVFLHIIRSKFAKR